jgi:hypothetical protein
MKAVRTREEAERRDAEQQHLQVRQAVAHVRLPVKVPEPGRDAAPRKAPRRATQ